MEKYAILDIETVPIQFDDIEVVRYQIEKNFTPGLHPAFSKIIIIGIKFGDENEPKIFHGENEKEIISDFWKELNNKKPELIVTWNGYKFDIPFIEMRSVIHNIKPEYRINTNPWKMLEHDSNHIDCMLLFSRQEKFANVSLTIACKLLGISVLPSEDMLFGRDVFRQLPTTKAVGLSLTHQNDTPRP